MSRSYGIGARHFFIREVPFRKGWFELLEQGLNEIWQESKKG